MRISGTFLSSSLARKFFLGVFIGTTVVSLSAGSLFYFLGDHLIRRAATEVLNESSRAFGRNLFDRLTAAERLIIKIADADSSTGSLALHHEDLDVFSTVEAVERRPLTASQAASGRHVWLEVQNLGASLAPRLALIVQTEGSKRAVYAVLQEQYIWDSAESALFNLCIQVDPALPPYCQRDEDVGEGTVQVKRAVIFRPFFDATPWEVTATASAELSDVLPVGVSVVAAGVCTLALMLALISTSIYLRRMTESLNGLMRVTRGARAGDFSQRVPIEPLKDELRELGDSFNSMMRGLQDNFEFRQVLSRIDAAVLERQTMNQIVAMVLSYAREKVPGWELRLLRRGADFSTVSWIDAGGLLQRERRVEHADANFQIASTDVEQADVGTIDGDVALLEWRRVAGQGPRSDEGSLREKLRDLSKRVAIASEAVSHERKLSLQATTDSLTGLSNRFGLVAELKSAIAEGRWDSQVDVVFCDLDRFKEVNDAYGHTVGDQMLQQLAHRMVEVLSQGPYHLARLGGDEFALLLPNATSGATIENLRVQLRKPVHIESRELKVTASIGVASFPSQANTVDDLLRKSDLAMYRSKSQGGDAICFFTPDMDEDAAERLDLLQHLRTALDTSALHVAFQPRAAKGTHQVKSAEALMRWKHPKLGWISPARFIPLAEESGLIGAMGDWILEQTCLQFKLWQAAGLGVQQISVNVSPMQLNSPDFFPNAIALLKAYEMPIGSIELEITEGALVQNIDATSPRLRLLQEAGFHIALDDFGVGFSALSYLSKIPFDTLKIDKSFVDEIHNSQVTLAIATAIVTLAKAMGKHIVAEGVELKAQADLLESIGADELQGYLFGKPMDALQFERAVTRVG